MNNLKKLDIEITIKDSFCQIKYNKNTEKVDFDVITQNKDVKRLHFKRMSRADRIIKVYGDLLQSFPSLEKITLDQGLLLESDIEIPAKIPIITKYLQKDYSWADDIFIEKRTYNLISQLEQEFLSQLKGLCRFEGITWKGQVYIKRIKFDNNGDPYIDDLVIVGEIPAGLFSLSYVEKATKLTVGCEEGTDFNGLDPQSGLYAIGNLENLKEFKLEAPYLEKLPRWIVLMEGIRILDVENISITELPEDIGNMTDLEILFAQLNFITRLPDSIGNLSNLKKLILHENRIEYLPDSIGELSNLRELNLTENQLKSIPYSIGKLSNLRELELAGNQLQSIPDSFENLTKVEKIDLSTNQLHFLTKSVTLLSQLKVLNIAGNQLLSIPDGIGKLINLYSLWLSDNNLENLPDSLENLKKLRYLDLGSNQFHSLPNGISKLINLRKLWLHETNLHIIPDILTKLDRLERIFVSSEQNRKLEISNDLKQKIEIYRA